MNRGEKAGEGEVLYKDKKIGEFDIVSKQDIPEIKEEKKKSLWECIKKVLNMI